MLFNVIGASAESGDDIDVILTAASQAEVERIAHEKGILVSTIRVASEEEDRSVELILEEDPPPTNGHAGGTAVHAAAAPAHAPAHAAPHGAPASVAPVESHERHGTIITNASSPSDVVHVGEGHIEEAKKADSAMEYHILLNQSLYLLETAVNKYIKDGWEPQGGLTVGMSNNALQYFQSIIRRKRPPGAKAVEPNKASTDAG